MQQERKGWTIRSFSIRLEDLEVLEELRKIANRERLSLSRQIVIALREYVKRHGHGNPQTPLEGFLSEAPGPLEARVPVEKCEFYRRDPLGKPYCIMDWGSPYATPERCYFCDTGRYSRGSREG